MPKQFKDFKKKYGPWALIAGGSEGIGGAYADLAASNGVNIIIVARNQEKLDKKALELKSRFHVDVLTLSIDLANPRLLEIILEKSSHHFFFLEQNGHQDPLLI